MIPQKRGRSDSSSTSAHDSSDLPAMSSRNSSDVVINLSAIDRPLWGHVSWSSVALQPLSPIIPVEIPIITPSPNIDSTESAQSHNSTPSSSYSHPSSSLSHSPMAILPHSDYMSFMSSPQSQMIVPELSSPLLLSEIHVPPFVSSPPGTKISCKMLIVISIADDFASAQFTAPSFGNMCSTSTVSSCGTRI